jgi:twitching motility protein PilT
MSTLLDLLETTVKLEGSDLHLTTGAPPVVRIHGQLHRLDDHESLTADETKQLVYSLLADGQKDLFEETSELDIAFGIPGGARFRCNVFIQRGDVAAVYRLIPGTILSIDELGLPPVTARFAELPRGLVLVTGPTGSGKSTTLAALIDTINTVRKGHILTIEDPVEFLHQHKSCIVNQREIHTDTAGFGPALRAALREDPDVVLIGEMRDHETIEAALRIAETGHLTFATLHTNSTAQTIDRIIDVFPAHQQGQIRTQLSQVLEGIICQLLVPTVGGTGRAVVVEVLVVTPAIRHLIREDKPHQIYSAMQASQGKIGMQTMNQSLATLYQAQRITLRQALAHSSNRDELQEMIKRGAGGASRGGSWQQVSRSGAPAGVRAGLASNG